MYDNFMKYNALLKIKPELQNVFGLWAFQQISVCLGPLFIFQMNGYHFQRRHFSSKPLRWYYLNDCFRPKEVKLLII